MNHPHREEWIPYVFGEASASDARSLKTHLDDCADCREEIEIWQRSLRRLDDWKLPAPAVARSDSPFLPALKWAAAAALVLTLGFSIGRSTAEVDIEQVRQALEPEIREHLSQEFATLLRQELDKVETQRVEDLVSLKRDLDTVAVLTDASLRRTENRLSRLASYTQPASFSTQPQD
jgi:hypothetical protein